jgi:putative ABC transport system permease protein
MTIIGIAGCTSLMVAAFGLRDSLVDIARTQFEQILKYDIQIDLHTEGDEAQGGNEVPKGVLANIGPYTPVHSESGFLIKDTERLPLSIIVPEKAEDLPKFVALQDLKTKQPLPFTPSTVTLTEKLAEQLNLQAGDRFMLENAAGKQGIFTLSSRTENYVGAICYIGSGAYQQAFGEGLTYQTMFARAGVRDPQSQDRLMSSLLAHPEVMGAAFLSEIQVSYTNLLASIGFVVLVLIFAAGGLAMIVLYNLTNININERKREIATLRVLGFHEGEAAAYIFREISVLSLLGAGLGLFLGIPLHRFIISVAENVDLMFGRQINPVSFVLSLGITLVFSVVVDVLMLKKIKSIRMSESMKTVD